MTRIAASAALALLTAVLPALGGDDKDKPDAVVALMKATRDSFLTVRITARELPADQRENEDPFTGPLLAGYARREIPLEMTGVVFNDKGWVLAPDRLLDLRMVAKIEGEPIGGKPVELVFLGVLRRTQLVVLGPKDPAAKLTAVKFAPCPKLDGETQLSGVALDIDDDELTFGGTMGAKPFIIRRPTGTEAWVFHGLNATRNMGIIGDDAGRPIGVLPPNFGPESGQEDFLWKAEDLAKQKLYAADRIEADRRRLAEKFAKAAFKVTLTFRTEGGGGGYYPRGEGDDREQTLSAIAIDPAHLLVPSMLNRKQAARIEKIEVELDEDHKLPATLVGALKTARAMIVKLDEGKLPAAATFAANTSLPWITPVMNAAVGEKYGKVDVQVYMDRCIGKDRSFGGVWRFKTLRQLRRGSTSVLLDEQARIVAISLVQRPPFETIRQIRQVGISRYSGDGPEEDEAVTFTGAELAAMVVTDPDQLDQRIRSVPKDDLYRRPWLGVEVTGLSAKLAEQLDIRKPTRDGELGMVVSVVYPGSPAEKLGIKPSDVLLKITPAGRPELDIELRSRFADYQGGSDYYADMEISEIDRATFVSPVWKRRDNFLTNLLDEIGIGEKIELTWLEGDKLRTRPLVIQMAPRDIRSARKATDEPTGLSVKELTYEVRQGYKLAPDAGGVLVVRAKSGSKAALARLGVFSIISKVNDQAVTDPDQFLGLLDAARKAAKSSVKLFVVTPGSSRFADLSLQ